MKKSVPGGLKSGASKLKTFLTTFKMNKASYCWEIKASGFAEAEKICKQINHKLDGEKLKI